MVKPRQADSTLKLIDEYCRYYRNLFSGVRSFEAFTHLHAGIISDIKRKTLLIELFELLLQRRENWVSRTALCRYLQKLRFNRKKKRRI